ncbi:type IX secretion system outer membrane channel protein PorV [Flavobacterium sp.]|uniref:type IX secretion system outer membrane channel protein PorV n=1 Tax=Flavobacterium sp. TaxID=239 RepID=UPI0035B0F169
MYIINQYSINRLFSIIFTFFLYLSISAQDKVITTGVPFLMVAADARAAGMADIGIASSTDAFSQQWNPAKYAFAEHKQGFSVSYTPYLTDLGKDISLGQVTYFNKINDRSSWSSSLRYFGIGNVQLRNNLTDQPRIVSPNELAFDGAYSLKLSNTFSMAVAGRYIRSNLKVATDDIDASAANTFAVDVAGFYQFEEVAYSRFNGIWRAGFNIQNLGPKISYDNDEFNTNFLPANLKIGTGFDFIFDEDNQLAINLELNKLLVPTPQNPDLNGDGVVTPEEYTQNYNDYRKIGWVSGLVKSFGDAPNGFSEELKEITYALGSEYVYKDAFAVRAGYFHESPVKGARQYFSLGAGFKYTTAKIDVSYLFSTSNIRNPLENTIRFSLTFNFGNNNTK